MSNINNEIKLLSTIIDYLINNRGDMDHPNFQKCWALDNLRPYSAKLNLQENNRK